MTRLQQVVLCLAVLIAPRLWSAPAPQVTAKQLNGALGIDLWSDTELWDDPAAECAKRLGWRQESKTSTLSSYRKYAGGRTLVAGARAYSLALYGEEGKVSSVSMVFTNKGDSLGFHDTTYMDRQAQREWERWYLSQISAFQRLVRTEATVIKDTLTPVLGSPSYVVYGQGELRERVFRWNWGNHALLLSSPRREYVRLQVVPKASADRYGRTERTTDYDLQKILGKRVKKRTNGDVVVTDIPMVNQGRKGYCVPATWERYLRYMGMSADMYVLAMAGGTGAGGGTRVGAIQASVSSFVSTQGRAVKTVNPSLRVRDIAKSIDKGLPLMWTVHVDRTLDQRLLERARLRPTDRGGLARYSKYLKAVRRDLGNYNPERYQSHMRMIIGYNKDTDELALSDSWGERYAEYWITVEEAEMITQGQVMLIRW